MTLGGGWRSHSCHICMSFLSSDSLAGECPAREEAVVWPACDTGDARESM